MTAISETSGMRLKTTRAVAMLAALNIGSRAVMVLSNWALGFFLSEEAFGINGMVGIVSTLMWAFVTFGLDEVLVQRGRSIHSWETTSFAATLVVSSVAALALVASAPVFAWAFGEPGIIGPLALLALALPLASLSTVPSAKINAKMQFGFITQWSMAELVFGQCLTIALAFLGFGPYSFVLPILAITAARAVAYHLHTPMVWNRLQPRVRRALLLRKGATAVTGKVASGLVAQADYIVLALMASTSALGFYYFAFRIAALPVRTIAVSLVGALFPAMSAFRSDPQRQSAAAVRAAALLCWVVSPLCHVQMVVARPLLILFFGDKWIQSVPVIEFLSVGLAIEAVMSVTRSYLSASGQFQLGLMYAVANGIGYFTACALGAYFGSITGLALAVSLYYTLTQPIAFALLTDRSNRKLHNMFEIFVLPTSVSLASFGAAWAISHLPILPQGPAWQIVIITTLGGVLFLGLAALTAPRKVQELLDIGRSFLVRAPKPATIAET